MQVLIHLADPIPTCLLLSILIQLDDKFADVEVVISDRSISLGLVGPRVQTGMSRSCVDLKLLRELRFVKTIS